MLLPSPIPSRVQWQPATMEADLLPLSKFKLQLLALVSEARHLRESERNSREELHRSLQSQRQMEAEHAQMLRELRAELASREELQRKLEAKVIYLENESTLMEKKEKELKQTVNSLLQLRDSFVSINEDSTYELRRSVEIRDRKLAVLSEKMQSHLLLFDSVEKEAAAVKQILNSVQHLVNEKEHVVNELKEKMNKISAFEKDFVEKICYLETKLVECQHELRRRNATVSELKGNLEVQKCSSDFQPQIEELRKALLVKEEVIRRLTSEKQALHLELQNLERTLHKIQDVVIYSSVEKEKVVSPTLEVQEMCEMVSRETNESLEDINQATGEDSPKKRTDKGSTNAAEEERTLENESPCRKHVQEHSSVNESPCKKHVPDLCLPKPSDYPSPQSMCPDPSGRMNALSQVSKDGNRV